MHSSTVAALVGLFFAAMVQAEKFHLATWRFNGTRTCDMASNIRDEWQFMSPGGCHSPKQQQEFDAFFYELGVEGSGDPSPESAGWCQLNAYDEPHCKGNVVAKSVGINMHLDKGHCMPMNEGTYGVSLQLKCSKHGFPKMAGNDD